jgi:rhodanese-related sulfurtransferase
MSGWPSVPTFSVQEAHEHLEDAGSGAILIDVRNPDEFAQARVPGSILMPLPLDREILIICATGNRSSTATAYLLGNGFERVANVAGGIVAWYRAGLPIVTGRPEPGEGELPR